MAVERSTGIVWESLGEVAPGGDITVRRGGSTRCISPSEVVPLPSVGQSVSIGDRRGLWLGVESVDADAQEIAYWVLDESHQVQRGRCSLAAVSAPQAATEAPTGDDLASGDLLAALARTLTESATTAVAVEARSKATLEAITRRLHAEADDRGYCSDFDEIMEEMGLESRRREHELSVEIEAFTVTVTVEARDRETAIDSLSQSTIDGAIVAKVGAMDLEYTVLD